MQSASTVSGMQTRGGTKSYRKPDFLNYHIQENPIDDMHHYSAEGLLKRSFLDHICSHPSNPVMTRVCLKLIFQ